MRAFFRLLSADPGGLWRVMGIMGLFLLLVQINRVGGGVLASALADTHGLAAATIGLVIGAMFFASAAAQIPVGLMIDRQGPRRMMCGLGAIAVAGITLFALAESVWGLIAARVLIGVGHGASITGIYLLVVAWVRPDRVATVAATVIAVAGGLGGLLATAPLALSITHIGFGPTFLSLAAVTSMVTLMIWFFVSDRPPSTPDNSAATRLTSRPAETMKETLTGLFEVIRNRNLWPIFVMALCFAAPFNTIGGLWAGPYLRDVYGLDPAAVGSRLFVMVLCLNIGIFIYGPLDRLFNTTKYVILGGVVLMVVPLTILSLMPKLPLPLTLGLFMIFSLASPIFVTLVAHCRGYVPEWRAGRAIAVIHLVGLGFIFVLQAVTGWLVDVSLTTEGAGELATELAYRRVFATVAVVLVLAGAIYACSRDVKPREITS